MVYMFKLKEMVMNKFNSRLKVKFILMIILVLINMSMMK